MKLTILTFAAVGLFLASCGGPDKAAYDKAAQTVCDCMSKKTAETPSDTLGLNIDMSGLDYSLCMLEIAGDVDPGNEEMAKSIKAKCGDLEETHADYVKSLKK